MMDKDTAAEMIQAKALGCLDSNDRKELSEYLNLGGEFPWKEFGEYQNLTSLLPIILEIEAPDVSVKDKVAQRIYDAIAELKSKKAGISELDNPESDFLYPDTTVLGDQITAENLDPGGSSVEPGTSDQGDADIIMPDATVTENLSEEIPIEQQSESINEKIESLSDDVLPLSVPDIVKESFPEELINESLNSELNMLSDAVPSSDNIPIEKKLKSNETIAIEKSSQVQSKYRTLLEEKSKRNPVDEIPLKKEKFIEPEKPQKKNVSGIMVDIIIYILLLAAIAFVYIRLSSEIDSLRKEINLLKQDTGVNHSEFNSTVNYYC